jgi:hypothetical protein
MTTRLSSTNRGCDRDDHATLPWRPGRPSRRPRRARVEVERLERRAVLSLIGVAPPVDVSGAPAGGQRAGQDRLVAQAADGHFVAVWVDQGVKARLFNADGTPRSGPITVAGSSGADEGPTVAMNAAGGFVVAYTHRFGATDRDIYAQAFRPDGSPRTGRVFAAALWLDEWAPSAGIDSGGNFAIAYTQQTTSRRTDVEVGRFDADGRQWQQPLDLGSVRSESQPTLAMNEAGRAIVAFVVDFGGTNRQVDFTQLDPGGGVRDLRAWVAGGATMAIQPAAAINASGAFAIAYTDVTGQVAGDDVFSPIDYFTDVRAVAFDPSGNRLRAIDARADPSKDEYDPAIVLSSDGRPAVAFTTGGQFDPAAADPTTSPDDLPLVRLRSFDAAGAPTGETTAGTAAFAHGRNGTKPSLALGTDSTATLLWQSATAKLVGDVYGTGVFAQPLLNLPYRATIRIPQGATELTVTNSMSSTFFVDIARDPGFTGPIDVSLAGLPSNYTATVRASTTASPTGVTDVRIVTINAPLILQPGSFTLNVRVGTSGSTPLSLPVTVVAQPLTAWTVTPEGSQGQYAIGPTGGLPGTTVLVSGRGFSPVMSVAFSGATAQVVVPAQRFWTDANGVSYLEVQVPAGARSGRVTIINPGGARATTSDGLLIEGPQVFYVDQRSGHAPQETRPGTTITMTGIGLAPGTRVSFGGADAEAAETWTSADGTVLRVNVPRYAVDGTLTVTPTVGEPIQAGSFTVYSFREQHAFAFPNFDFAYGLDMFMDAWGSQSYFNFLGWRIPYPETVSFWAAAKLSLDNKGACFGMALTAERLIQHPELARGTLHLKDPNGYPFATNVLDNDAARHYIEMQHIYQYSQEVIDYFLAWQGAGHSAAGVYDLVRSELQAGRHPLISMREGPGDGHVVLAYDLEGTADHFKIDTYDPNLPFMPNEQTDAGAHRGTEMRSQVEITPDGRWKFREGNNVFWEGGFGSMTVIPTTVVPDQPRMVSVLGSIQGIVFGTTPTASPASSLAVDLAPDVIAPPKTSQRLRPRRSAATLPFLS